ncbi:hypothetical protein GGR51DRAFT_452201 [Nemania sp. FL0031]|nr:hypothetical protein GGR51DRAFT_452201 [Nemania sp. FL0031]
MAEPPDRRGAADGNKSEDSQHLVSELSESCDGGALPRPSVGDAGQSTAEITPNPDGDDDITNPSHRSSPLGFTSDPSNSQERMPPWPRNGPTTGLQIGGRSSNPMEKKTPATSEGALDVSSMVSASRPTPPSNATLSQPIESNDISSSSYLQTRTSGATPNEIVQDRDGIRITIGSNQQEHTRHASNTRKPPNRTLDPGRFRAAYVEDATDSDEAAPRSNMVQEELSPSRSRPSLSEDMNHTRPRPKHRKPSRARIARPRRTDTPSAPPMRYWNHQPNASASDYGLQPGPDVPPYISGYEPPYNPYYGQHPGFYAPSVYPSYVQYQQGNPSYFAANPNYPQPPPPPSTIISERAIEPQSLDPDTSELDSRQDFKNPFHDGSAVEPAFPYIPPVSSDPSGHDISFHMSLKYSSMPNSQGKQNSVMFDTSYSGEMSENWEMGNSSPRIYKHRGKSYLTRIQSLEYYVDRSSQDRITILPPKIPDMSALDGTKELRWLHIQHDAPCLNHLRELIGDCRHLDDDLKSLTDSFLESECARFEKKHFSESRDAYYIEPGTVLRCDVGYGQESDRGEKSIFFCSVPYLQLGRHDGPNDVIEEENMRIHPTRTLMESLYDCDLPDGRDSRQAILRSSSEQDNILYVPQIWYILCGSDILISYSRLSLDEIQGGLIKTRSESKRSLIATVTDLDSYQFSVAFETTDSYFVSLFAFIIVLS